MGPAPRPVPLLAGVAEAERQTVFGAGVTGVTVVAKTTIPLAVFLRQTTFGAGVHRSNWSSENHPPPFAL